MKHEDYTYSATGQKLAVGHFVALPNVTWAFGVKPNTSQHTAIFSGHTDYLLGGSLIVQEGATKMLLFDGGYAKAERTGSNSTNYGYTLFYYTQDHLGNNREVRNSQGGIQQTTDYYPFGGIITDTSGDQDIQPYKYNGKELDRMHGLNTYDYGARQYYSILGRWDRVDPLCEKYYSLSPYNYCGNNPVNAIDIDGCDWYKDRDATYQYNPNINKDSQLAKGQSYIGETFRKGGAWYRNDGSILFNNETAAYNRMWNQADLHYRRIDSGGREVGEFILKDRKVLVLPDYANDNETTKIDYYGYHIQKNGIVTHGDEKFNVIGQVHTHQNKSLNAEPSTYLGDSYGDLGLSAYNSSLPVFTIGHDNKIHGIRGYIGRNNVPVGLIVNMNSRDSSRHNLLNGKTSLFSIIQRLSKL